jgi:hypothetical protein
MFCLADCTDRVLRGAERGMDTTQVATAELSFASSTAVYRVAPNSFALVARGSGNPDQLLALLQNAVRQSCHCVGCST